MTVVTATNIANTPEFQKRVNFLMVKAAITKLNAVTPATPDILLGQRILKGVESVLLWSYAALVNATIMAGAHADDGATIQDIDLESSVNSCWLAFSL